MVFCGRPSKGCHACRAKKTKCDAVPTGCTQCSNAGRACPGYRSQTDVIFREETKSVIKKAKVKHEKAKQRTTGSISPSSTTPNSNTSSLCSSRESSSSQRDIVVRTPQPSQIISINYFNITPSIEDKAAAFFLSNYVIGDHGPTRGHLDLLSDLYESNSIDDNLVAAVHAVGLAGYSHSAKAPQLMNQARAQYAKSLQLTNAALQSPIAVKKDSTLLAILILGIFETITGRNQKSMKAWAEHIHGAAAVIRLRGREAIKSKGGIRLLAQVTSSLLTSCLQRDIAIPKYITEMTAFAEKTMTNIDPAWIAQKIMVDYTAFNARYHAGQYTDPDVLLNEAQALDERFLAFYNNVPKGWEHTIIHTNEDPDIVFEGYYHIYHDHWVAQIWNAIAGLRILLNETIRDVLIQDFASASPRLQGAEYASLFQKSTTTIYTLQSDILASIPQHIGYCTSTPHAHPQPHRNPHPQNLNTNFPSSLSSPHSEKFPTLRFSGGYFLIWPLFLVGISRVSTKEVRAFCVRTLKIVGLHMGIQHAFLLARIMEGEVRVTVW
ncbi:e6c83758-c103-4d61-bf07-34e01271705b [Sclerotinia trifoliorum]|uniref:E6c83758-c103-4d61-bf07-34e01271705b n=1 Tax=Sclerotinia trifoliorum TaxID=28548 RepID=A0A8H2ZT18_9HELO|nr:e6c83758-c103-4d61-bf07-34e01271705b [Sclerotinia trifoliorum]